MEYTQKEWYINLLAGLRGRRLRGLCLCLVRLGLFLGAAGLCTVCALLAVVVGGVGAVVVAVGVGLR